MQVKAFIIDHLEEVKNRIGGVIGYRLQLSAEETEQLLKLVEATQPYLEVAEKARGWRIAEMAVPPTSNPALWEAEQARLTKRQLEALQALRAAVDKLPK